ncbi:hypothetical protein GCM10007028_04480 [Algibacter mikhailovii]|uniref:Uncharacterized protein n=2 Tax=Algibacter mikhailovii TaxID=425498 RepID=A0A918V5H9_9FLAO|nr:hypothetical protein GCM10007028_04480 [Algibacter mikhailovii]
MTGLDKHHLPSKVIGISVGRNRERAEEIVTKFYKELCVRFNIVYQNRNTIVLDEYMCEGYQKYNDEIFEISNESIAQYGFA